MKNLEFKTKIKGKFIRHEGLADLKGKEVRVLIKEIQEQNQKQWKLIGSLNLKGELDLINIRDFANE
ncbi:MAG: hypothetical protein K9J12_16270 [Melioribacteraceae bacterium]|nr:hypothetical protein [Melioribacteraceae bacterium]MCF8263992.1 hypothetical protein [Melioribacteraceae bacterium]MCF8430749.1 hypothetical protein [Melioribacteraceae bacterium]